MRLIYEAQNTVEAHMVLNLLEQAGLKVRIDGEYLQGGIGEIQAIGVIRVMISADDYTEGKVIVDEWDARQPIQESDVQNNDVKKGGGFGVGLISFICGVAAMAIYYHTPVTHDGIDYNGDGVLDEKWTYVNNLISKTEYDSNLDGDIDVIYLYDRKGLIQSSSSDNNFNGIFETETYYDRGNAVWQKSDTTEDGFKNYKINFKHGLLNEIIFLDPETKKTIKIQKYGSFSLESAKLDASGDGFFDTYYEYDSIEEISRKYNK
jgi:hypothetical protein